MAMSILQKSSSGLTKFDPDALLVYNDYGTENPGKRDRIYNMLKELLDAGVPVHAVGLQGHWSITDPTEENLRATIDKFSSLGIKVQVTERMFLSIPAEPDTLNLGFTPEREQKQIDLYKMAFNVSAKRKMFLTVLLSEFNRQKKLARQ